MSEQPVTSTDHAKHPPTVKIVKSNPKEASDKADVIPKENKENNYNNVVEIYKKQITDARENNSTVNPGKLLTAENDEL
ncbi:MAG: hypothetical protein KZQ57_02520, partial [gamma proteobacterium symbiont of Lucinoma myriamae]|nr:hypothetical protein [gamma proteobacterium symbiont of Lucinoma myriamae]